jgi:AhpD family alkylhydroperoxidase
MDDRTKELFALCASAAVNCRPCLEHHLELARGAGAGEREIVDAMEVGMAVNRGAARHTRTFIEGLVGVAVGADD